MSDDSDFRIGELRGLGGGVGRVGGWGVVVWQSPEGPLRDALPFEVLLLILQSGGQGVVFEQKLPLHFC